MDLGTRMHEKRGGLVPKLSFSRVPEEPQSEASILAYREIQA